jgi:hypothetical protein
LRDSNRNLKIVQIINELVMTIIDMTQLLLWWKFSLFWYFVLLQFIKNLKTNPIRSNSRVLDGWIVSGGVAFLHAGHKTGLMCTTVYLLISQSLIFVFVLGSWPKLFFSIACILVEVVWNYRLWFIAVFWVSTNCRPH